MDFESRGPEEIESARNQNPVGPTIRYVAQKILPSSLQEKITLLDGRGRILTFQ